MYSKDISKMCANCQKGTAIPLTNDVMCEIRGVVPYNYLCKKYKYDIFTKKLRRRRDISGESFKAQDFSID